LLVDAFEIPLQRLGGGPTVHAVEPTRRLTVRVLLSSVALMLATPAGAGAVQSHEVRDSPDALECADGQTTSLIGFVECIVSASEDDEDEVQSELVAPGSGNSQWPPPGMVLVVYPSLGLTDTGEICRQAVTRAVPSGQAEAIRNERTTSYWLEVANRPPELRPIGDCPPGSAPELDAREAQQAMVTLLRQRLPRPQLRIAPGFGLTGMPAYLETGRGLSVASEPLRVDLSTGPVSARFRGQAAYTVDWGDGTVTGPHREVGAPWPDGTVTHTYVDEGSFEVRVSDRWSVTFTVDGLPAQTVGLDLTGDALRFEVRERRSVRTTP
jgi:hypothetical protein